MRSGRLIVVSLLASLCGVSSWAPARAASIETLLMPGKVSAAHAKVESECGKCHDRANRPHQLGLCLECHKPIADDIREHRGLHGKREGAAETQCSVCHTEHLGRDGRIVNLQSSQFEHSKTDFKLDGAHIRVACASCHVADKKHSEAPGRCVECHKAVEPHEGKLGTDCASCHDTQRWSGVHYDHGKTRFTLQGRHAEIACTACHAGNRWKDTPLQCVSCHATDDVHRTQRGIKCGECHTQRAWDEAKFDHEKETGFALVGTHAKASCQSCHTTGNFKDKLPKDCMGCHAAADSHAGRLGTKCDSCHAADAKAWKPAHFDHAKDGKYVLEGRHAKLACHDCHTAPVAKQKLGKECVGCHRANDVHGGTLGKQCENCHGVESWKSDIRFDHDLTHYPLIGQHVVVPCAQCHATRRYTDVPKTCLDCHAARDVHQGGLGKDCARCHSPNGWNLWEFDHQKESGFALLGAHAKLACNACHKQPAGQVKLGKDCASCHTKDDIHLGQFGRQCDRCHSSISFHRVRPQ
jgi:hypothetical protein